MADLRHIAVLIPAYQPEDRLVVLVGLLHARGFGAIIVVDDGSEARCDAVFSSVQSIATVHLVRHAQNLGKGCALKSGIEYFLNTLPDFVGLVTADADGQHTAPDIERVADAMDDGTGSVAIGVRTFATDVPLRSRFGNVLTQYVFWFATGARLVDTQTGLRAFPKAVLPQLLALKGDRYEYEMTVLAHLCRRGARPIEVPIETVYIDGNNMSHFDPIRDSIRIYSVLARLYFS